MNNRKSISLVIIDTDNNPLARRAVERTVSMFPVDDVLIFSDQSTLWSGFSVNRVNKILSHSDYNHIILLELANKIKTDYALIIQFDGFVINPSSFNDFFYKFDYIGAPWPAGTVFGKGAIVGNGGFSLRSRKLIEAIPKYCSSISPNVPEDATICRYLRTILEEFDGIVFAPVEVARYFSFEMEAVKDNEPFGFHGLHLLPKFYEKDYQFLIDNIPDRCLKTNSYQLHNLQQGFLHLNPEAQALFALRLEKTRAM
jgi:hypothetical protein